MLNSVPVGCEIPDSSLDVSLLDIAEGYPKRFVFENETICWILRPINSKKIIFGCGNRPANPYYYTMVKVGPGWNKKVQKRIVKRNALFCHCHEDSVTIDIDLSMNPTIWGNYEFGALRCVKDDAFEECDFEGLMLPEFDTPEHMEVCRVVKNFDRNGANYERAFSRGGNMCGESRFSCNFCGSDDSLLAEIRRAERFVRSPTWKKRYHCH